MGAALKQFNRGPFQIEVSRSASPPLARINRGLL